MGGAWNEYDIEFRAKNVEVPRATQAGLDETCNGRGVMLQDHSTVVPVSFRNIGAIQRN